MHFLGSVTGAVEARAVPTAGGVTGPLRGHWAPGWAAGQLTPNPPLPLLQVGVLGGLTMGMREEKKH